jgi:hypothetical protein
MIATSGSSSGRRLPHRRRQVVRLARDALLIEVDAIAVVRR